MNKRESISLAEAYKRIEEAIKNGEATVNNKPKAITNLFSEQKKAKSGRTKKQDLHDTVYVPSKDVGRPDSWIIGVYTYCGDNSASGFKAKFSRSGHERVKIYNGLARYHQEFAKYATHAQSEGRTRISITRLGPREMDYSNVVAALKYVQDAVSHFLGVDDGKKWLVWEYGAEKSNRYGVRIELEIL